MLHTDKGMQIIKSTFKIKDKKDVILAINHFEEAIKLDPNNEIAQKLLIEAKNYKETYRKKM